MKTISASDANRNFSGLLREVASGATVTILSRRKPVATLSPVQHGTAVAQRVARQRLIRHLRMQPVQSVARSWRRDELYEDD